MKCISAVLRLAEVRRVARESGCAVMVTHMKAWGPGFRGEAATWIGQMQAARDKGLRVFMDVHPYDSSGSDGNLLALPSWAIGESPEDEALIQRARPSPAIASHPRGPARMTDLPRDIVHQVPLKGGAENIRIPVYPENEYVDRTLARIRSLRGQPLVETVIALQLDGNPRMPGDARMRAFSMVEADIEAFYAQPWCATPTDGWIVLPEDASGPFKHSGANRRCFGSYPRRLAHDSPEGKVDTATEAVRKCSALPADMLNVRDRGRLLPGMKLLPPHPTSPLKSPRRSSLPDSQTAYVSA